LRWNKKKRKGKTPGNLLSPGGRKRKKEKKKKGFEAQHAFFCGQEKGKEEGVRNISAQTVSIPFSKKKGEGVLNFLSQQGEKKKKKKKGEKGGGKKKKGEEEEVPFTTLPCKRVRLGTFQTNRFAGERRIKGKRGKRKKKRGE